MAGNNDDDPVQGVHNNRMSGGDGGKRLSSRRVRGSGEQQKEESLSWPGG